MPWHEKPRIPIQLDLFCERPETPTWHELPPEVRARICPLLARLLRSQRRLRPGVASDAEVGDE